MAVLKACRRLILLTAAVCIQLVRRVYWRRVELVCRSPHLMVRAVTAFPRCVFGPLDHRLRLHQYCRCFCLRIGVYEECLRFTCATTFLSERHAIAGAFTVPGLAVLDLQFLCFHLSRRCSDGPLRCVLPGQRPVSLPRRPLLPISLRPPNPRAPAHTVSAPSRPLLWLGCLFGGRDRLRENPPSHNIRAHAGLHSGRRGDRAVLQVSRPL